MQAMIRSTLCCPGPADASGMLYKVSAPDSALASRSHDVHLAMHIISMPPRSAMPDI